MLEHVAEIDETFAAGRMSVGCIDSRSVAQHVLSGGEISIGVENGTEGVHCENNAAIVMGLAGEA